MKEVGKAAESTYAYKNQKRSKVYADRRSGVYPRRLATIKKFRLRRRRAIRSRVILRFFTRVRAHASQKRPETAEAAETAETAETGPEPEPTLSPR